jgi:hypothetical protein
MEKSGKGLSGESVDILVGKIIPLELETGCTYFTKLWGMNGQVRGLKDDSRLSISVFISFKYLQKYVEVIYYLF